MQFWNLDLACLFVYHVINYKIYSFVILLYLTRHKQSLTSLWLLTRWCTGRCSHSIPGRLYKRYTSHCAMLCTVCCRCAAGTGTAVRRLSRRTLTYILRGVVTLHGTLNRNKTVNLHGTLTLTTQG